MTRICFVCLGNICRSPTAEGVLRHLLRGDALEDEVVVDSAGVGRWHVGSAPDSRTRAAAARRGYELEHRAWCFESEDFARFDLVVAMDNPVLEELAARAPDEESRTKLRLFRAYEGHPEADVPDPYGGRESDFRDVLEICERGCEGLIARLKAGSEP